MCYYLFSLLSLSSVSLSSFSFLPFSSPFHVPLPLSPQLEFMRGLLQEVETKISHDIPEMVYDEVLMSHLIDELLLFERELRTVLHYPSSCPSPFHNVMLEDVAFHKWLTLEKTC